MTKLSASKAAHRIPAIRFEVVSSTTPETDPDFEGVQDGSSKGVQNGRVVGKRLYCDDRLVERFS